jgi:hypothetical protein
MGDVIPYKNEYERKRYSEDRGSRNIRVDATVRPPYITISHRGPSQAGTIPARTHS